MFGTWFVGMLAQAEPLADAAAEAVKKAEPAAAAIPAWQLFLIIGVVFIAPFLLGQLLAWVLKLKDISFPVGVVLCTIFLSVTPFLYKAINGEPMLSAIPLGIDLAGGTNLIYAIDRQQAEADGKTIDNATLNKMIGAISRRINPSGAEEVTVRRVGEDRIEIIIPGADSEMVARKKRQIVDLGQLEFAILANDKDHSAIIESARKLRDDQDNLIQGDGGRVVASWRNVAEGEDVRASQQYRTVEREVERTIQGKTKKVVQLLVVHEPVDRAVTGRYLTRVSPTMDENGQLAVSFNFNGEGARRFSRLTGNNQPDATDGFHRCLAVLLNGEIQTAPQLKSRITNSGQISGNFTKPEVDELVNVLNAGALEVPLIRQPVSEFTISPTLGVDVQTKGFTAIAVSLMAVLVFMLVYYGVSGIVANLCLVLNLLLVVGSMAFIEATFTLAGLAGLVLTIGMAVDANVLIYERIREELARGSSLRMAIENGFDKAFSTIIDSNVTSLMTAVILYMIGSDQIRGFAVTLFIGLAMSLFTVLYFAHLCFNIIERKRWVKTLKMRQFFGETKFDFLATRKIAFAGSVLFIAAGLAALYTRGDSNYDIDFTGGTMVTFEFVDAEPTSEVKTKLVEQFGANVTLERLVLASETSADASAGHRFRMRTTELDQQKVTEGVAKAFGGGDMELQRVTMEAGPVEAIAAAEPDAEADRFAGGHRANVKFSTPLAADTAAGYLMDALRSLKGEEDAPKYQAVDSLMAVSTPSAKPDSVAVDAASQKSAEMVVKVMPSVAEEDLSAALAKASATLASTPAFEEVNSFASSVAAETRWDALYAVMASLVVIVVYIWYRFEKVYFGFAAVVALAHDVLVTLGAVAIAAYLSGTPLGPILMLEDFKINLALVASLLTIVGYSLNDTIVIFDRIREIRGKNPKITYDMINLSVNQTLSRTVLTAVSTAIVVVILYAFGGSGIHGFAFSMIIGVVTGVYSTVYIANPVLYWLIQQEHNSPSTPRAVPEKAAAAS